MRLLATFVRAKLGIGADRNKWFAAGCAINLFAVCVALSFCRCRPCSFSRFTAFLRQPSYAETLFPLGFAVPLMPFG
jgi:hypothetical protein